STAEVMDILDPHHASPPDSVLDLIDQWLGGKSSKNILRISLADITYEHNMREIVVNTIGRHLLSKPESTDELCGVSASGHENAPVLQENWSSSRFNLAAHKGASRR
ncbi:MAG: hypothetical protein L0G99_17240, partial [Propionibacteriales bacterium]|nr:hypothetical protein [Propionibacteriales bacterium]